VREMDEGEGKRKRGGDMKEMGHIQRDRDKLGKRSSIGR